MRVISTAKSSIKALANLLQLPPKAFCHVVGCPRSGTTAIGGWLDHQKGIVGINESRVLILAHHAVRQISKFRSLNEDEQYFFKYLRKLVLNFYGRSRFIWGKVIIEKEPLEPIAIPDNDYEGYLRNIQCVFPDVKILFIIRDPISTIWSMRNRKWGYSLTERNLREFTLDECIEIWNRNAMLIHKHLNNPNTFLCKFEDIVQNPKSESVKLFDFLEIKGSFPFEPKETKSVGFSDADTNLILNATKELRPLFGY